MKTIEERARAYQKKIEEANPQAEAYDFERAYIAGAEDEHVHLMENLKIAFCREHCDDEPCAVDCNLFKDFKKLLGEKEDEF